MVAQDLSTTQPAPNAQLSQQLGDYVWDCVMTVHGDLDLLQFFLDLAPDGRVTQTMIW
jgi:hypothetical protein